MHVFTRIGNLEKFLAPFRASHLTMGCVPTMGALHIGHMALMRKSIEETDLTVATIFVNPTQFNQASDLEKYPRPLQADLILLEDVGVDVLFLPTVDEVYPEDFQPVEVDLGGLDQPMEGQHRPGHFAGVVTVVHRLLSIVGPDRLYMGLKDYQQQAIIGRMIAQLDMPVLLRPCPIVREQDGLAYSSRNVRLDKESRSIAPLLHETLIKVRDKFGTVDPAKLMQAAKEELLHHGFEPEYVEIVDGNTLQRIVKSDHKGSVVVCVAAWMGGVRLIDNLLIRQDSYQH